MEVGRHKTADASMNLKQRCQRMLMALLPPTWSESTRCMSTTPLELFVLTRADTWPPRYQAGAFPSKCLAASAKLLSSDVAAMRSIPGQQLRRQLALAHRL